MPIDFRALTGKVRTAKEQIEFERNLWDAYDKARQHKLRLLQSMQTDKSGKTGITTKPKQQNIAMAKKAPPKSSRQSLASLWDETDASEANNNLPEGEQTVRVNKIVRKDDPKKGSAVFVEYECTEGENEGQTGRQMYKLTDASGDKAPGMAYLKRDLALMGYDDVDGKKMKKVLAEITEEQPMVVVNVKENGAYVNVYLVGLADEDATESDDEDEDEDEDEEEETPKKKGKKAPAKKKKADEEDEDEDDEEEEEEEDEDEDDEEEEETPKKKKKVADDDDEEDEDEDDEEEDEDDDDDDEDEDDEEEDEDDEEEDEDEAPKKKKKK